MIHVDSRGGCSWWHITHIYCLVQSRRSHAFLEVNALVYVYRNNERIYHLNTPVLREHRHVCQMLRFLPSQGGNEETCMPRLSSLEHFHAEGNTTLERADKLQHTNFIL